MLVGCWIPVSQSVTVQPPPVHIEVHSLGKVHVDGSRDNAIVPGVGPVAGVIWYSLAQVVDHASEEMDLPPWFLGRRANRGGTTVPS